MYKANISPFADGFYRIIVTAEQGYDLRNDGTTNGNWVDVTCWRPNFENSVNALAA